MIDQKLSELTRCYSNVDLPVSVDSTIDLSKSLEELILSFGVSARKAIHMPTVERFIAENMHRAASDSISVPALTELFWILFARKDWSRLTALAATMRDRLPSLPLHVADLIFLAFYRGQRERLVGGLDRDGILSGADSTIAFLRKWWPEADSHTRVYDAMVSHIMGDVDCARQVFAASGDIELIEPFAGVSSVLLQSEYDEGTANAASLEVATASSEHAVLLSLDRGYFEKYAFFVAKRFAVTNPENALHFHCVGFDPRPSIEEWQLPTNIGFTIDRSDLTRMDTRRRRGYFAAARYLHLARYLDMYQSVFVADVDGHVTRNVRNIADEHSEDDVVLSTKVLESGRVVNRLPWESITACAFMAFRTSGGRRFARLISGYLQKILFNAEANGRPIWYADQTALFYSWRDSMADVRFSTFKGNAFIQRGSWQLFQGEKERLAFLAGA